MDDKPLEPQLPDDRRQTTADRRPPPDDRRPLPPATIPEPAVPETPAPPVTSAEPPTPVAEAPVAPTPEPVAPETPVLPAAITTEPATLPTEPPVPVAETAVPRPEPVAAPAHAAAAHEQAHGREYPRFRLMARIEHITLLISFTILCLTGLPQKFPFSPISQGLITLLGGIEVVRLIHRWAAIVLILGTVYHLLTSAYRLFVKHEDMRMLPDLKDATDLRDTVAYNLGFIEEAPKMRKFNFGEKFEYWAVVWGTAVMIMTGFILWNPIAATQFIPGNFIPVALEAHGWEAVLAAVSIVIWHLYNVLVKHRNVSMFTGTLSHKIMEEEHGLELERLEAGGDPWRVVPPAVLARRRRVYFVVAGIVAVMALALVVWMFTFEDTAIIAVPEATRNIFVPLATPTP